MKNILLLIIAVVLISIIGIAYYATSEKTDNTVLLGSDDTLTVEGKIDLILTFEDGKKETITGKIGNPLSVKYDGGVVETATWRLRAKASTPSGSEAFDNCELSVYSITGTQHDSFNLDTLVYSDLDDDAVPDQNGFTWTEEWLPTSVGPAQTVIIEVDDGEYHTFIEHDIDFDDVFTGSETNGKYVIQFNPDGYSTYRGTSSSSDGDWKEVDWTGGDKTSAYVIQLTGSDITVNWDADVIWT